MNKTIIKAPQLGVNDQNATIIEWYINDGEQVDNGDILCSIETTKTSLEIEAEANGVIKILKDINSVVSINEPICIIYSNIDQYKEHAYTDFNKYNENSKLDLTITKKAQLLIDKTKIDIKKYYQSGIIKEKDVIAIIDAQQNQVLPIDINSEKINIFIYGASQGGFTAIEALKSKNIEIVGFIDDDHKKQGKYYNDYPVFSPSQLETLKDKKNVNLFVAIAHSKIREEKFRWAEKNSITVISVIHPQAYISQSVQIGKGCHIKAGAIIDSNTKIGEGCIIDNNVTLAHDNNIENFCHLAPGASLGSNINIGKYSIVGIGSSISTGINIAQNCIISVGSSIKENIKSNSVVEGNPGKVIGTKK